MESVIKNIYAQAKLLGCCPLFKGTEDLQGIIRLFTTTQGLEFCMTHHFPNIATLRLFKKRRSLPCRVRFAVQDMGDFSILFGNGQRPYGAVHRNPADHAARLLISLYGHSI